MKTILIFIYLYSTVAFSGLISFSSRKRCYHRISHDFLKYHQTCYTQYSSTFGIVDGNDQTTKLKSSKNDEEKNLLPSYERECWIVGRRCFILPQNNVRDEKDSSITKDCSNPPLIVLGGMAQTLENWMHHLRSLSSMRHIIFVECLGQGLGNMHPSYSMDESQDVNTNYSEYYNNVTLAYQATNLNQILMEAFPGHNFFDLAGFSLGGRIGLALASTYPSKIRKLHLTGVCAERDEYGKLLLVSWKEKLKAYSEFKTEMDTLGNTRLNGDSPQQVWEKFALRPYMWSAVINSYSPSFLISCGSEQVKMWVDRACESNNFYGILSLMDQTHANDIIPSSIKREEEGSSFWQPIAMAKRICSYNGIHMARFNVGSLDVMAPEKEVRRLCEILSTSKLECTQECDEGCIVVYEGCGHAVPMERASQWRKDLEYFLSL